MTGGGPDLDAHTAQYQTRDLLRDAPLRLGAYAMFVALGLGFVFVNYAGVNIHWLVVAGCAAVVGALSGIFATARAASKDAIRVDRGQNDRTKRKQAELDTFLEDQAK